MARLIKKIAQAKGLPPGYLEQVQDGEPAAMTVFTFNEAEVDEKRISSLEEVPALNESQKVSWINVVAPKAGVLRQIRDCLGIHPLVLEDVLYTGQRAKLESYDNYLFVVFKMIYEEEDQFIAEQISLIVGPNYVISFQEKPSDVFDYVRERIRGNKGRVRKCGADYLTYTLLDAVVDHYFTVLEELDDEIEAMDEKLMRGRTHRLMEDIYEMKRDLIFLRKQIWPIREMINGLLRNETKLIKKTTGIYLRDVYDHAVQVIDTVESFRDMVAGLQDVYLSLLSNRMNEVMKFLTIFAAIFIPLTFIAGIYGMNFQYMPELQWRWGYFVVLTGMAVLAVSMIVFFKRKRWI